jgi:hypothetical protein
LGCRHGYSLVRQGIQRPESKVIINLYSLNVNN